MSLFEILMFGVALATDVFSANILIFTYVIKIIGLKAFFG